MSKQNKLWVAEKSMMTDVTIDLYANEKDAKKGAVMALIEMMEAEDATPGYKSMFVDWKSYPEFRRRFLQLVVNGDIEGAWEAIENAEKSPDTDVQIYQIDVSGSIDPSWLGRRARKLM